MIYYLYIYMMLNILFFMMILSLYCLMFKFIVFMEFEILNVLSIKFDYIILFDWISLLFISLVLMISMSVIVYSIEYMNSDLNFNRFFFLVIMFVISMIFMVMSPNLLSILLGWDGLGLVSYCLVIFYQNEVSFNSGMVTVLMNRIGDIFILISTGFMMMLGSLNFMFLCNLDNMIMYMIMIISFTKSAQIPFSSWLPKAMSAPTPVSSLVHSSTLVTAGVYMLIRFNYLFMMNMKLMNVMMFVSLMTMLMSGVMASMEFDLKKIIALSTLSQLALMIFCLSVGLLEVSFFHLITHAMFKSMLFMCAGIIIHNMMLHQDIRFISMIYFNMPIVSLIFNCSSFALMGLPFLSGFFSKDKILDLYLMSNLNQFIFMILFMSMGLTSGYSIRLIYYSFVKFPNNMLFCKFNSVSSLMVYSMLILFFLTIFMGFTLSWLIFSMKGMIFLTSVMKLMIYLFMLMGIFISFKLSKMFFEINKIVMMFKIMFMYYYMWFLSLLYKFDVILMFNYSLNLNFALELGWNEYLYGNNMIYFMKKIYLYDLYEQFFFLMIFIYYLILLFMFI